MRRRAHGDDLFEIFPDLPRMWHPRPENQIAHVRRQVEVTRERARGNIARQREVTGRVRAALSARRRR